MRENIQSLASRKQLCEQKVRCEQERPPPWECHGRRRRRGLRANRKALCFRCDGKPLLAASGEFTLPHADHGAMFGQAVFHGGDDLFGKRDLRNLSALFLGCPAHLIARNGGVRSSAHGADVASSDFAGWQTGSTSRGAVADHIASPTGNGLRLMPDDCGANAELI